MSTVDVATIGIGVDATAVTKANQELSKMDAISGKLTNTVKNFIGAWAGYRIIKSVIVESAMLNARFETMGIVMNIVGRNAGYTATQMKEYELSLRKTGIAMIEAREVLSRMAQAQLDLSKTSELARVAQDAAVIGGINSSQAFERLVHGIQSAQVETLRTIGINVNFEASYDKLARQLNRNRQSLTETEKAQARMNEVLEYGSRIAGTYEASMGTAGKQLQSMKRYVDDLKVKFGEVFNEALTAAVFGFSGSLKDANKAMDDLAADDTIEKWGKSVKLIFVALAEAINSAAVAAERLGAYAGHRSNLSDIRDRYDAQLKSLKDDASFTTAAKRAEIMRQRDAALARENSFYEAEDAKLRQRIGGVWKAAEDQQKMKDKQRADDLAKEAKYQADLQSIREAYAGFPEKTKKLVEQELYNFYYPEKTVKEPPPAATTPPKATKQDELQTVVDSTLVKRTMEYEKLLARLEGGYGHIKKGSDLYRQSLEQLNEKYADVIAKGDVLGDKMYRATDPATIQFIQEQVAAYGELQASIADSNKELDEWIKTLSTDYDRAVEDAAASPMNAAMAEAGRWLEDQFKALEQMRKAGADSRSLDAVKTWLNMIARIKFDAARFQGTVDEFTRFQGIISQREQQIQAQTEAGLISQTEAAMQLRDMYGQVADAMNTQLGATLDYLLDTEKDEAKLAVLRKIVAEIQRLAEIGKQQGWVKGALDGMKQYADAVTDAYTTAKEAATQAFKSMEDSLVEFVTTGKLEFGNLVDSILADIARLMIQQTITKPLAQMVGGFDWMSLLGGLFSANGNGFASGQVQAFASGGILGPNGGLLTRPTIFPMANGGVGVGGEAGTEAVMPLKRGSDGKLGVSADNTAAPANVVVNVIESPGNGGKTQERTEGNTRILDVMVEQIKAAIGSDIARGGSVASSMERTYGLNRSAGAF